MALPEWLRTANPEASYPHNIANLGARHPPRLMAVLETYVCLVMLCAKGLSSGGSAALLRFQEIKEQE
jgi:hypothetical protein